MKIPAGQMKQIMAMIQGMMPFDYDHQPETKEAIAISKIFESLKQHKPELEDWSGFLGYLIADIDKKTQSQIAVQNILHDISDVLDEYNGGL